MNIKKFFFYIISFFILFFISILAIEISLTIVVKSGYEDQTNMSKKYSNLTNDYMKQDNSSEYNFYLLMDYRYYLDNKFNDQISHYPLSNTSNSKTIFCKENNVFKSIQSDRFGFNNSNKIYEIKNHDAAIIGDSFGYGSCVDTKDNVVGHLNKLGLDTLNFSSSGHGMLSYYATLKEYVTIFKPNNVILLWYEGNDFHNTQDEFESTNLKLYFENNYHTQNLANKQNLTDEIFNNFYKKSINSDYFIINEYDFILLDLFKFKNLKNFFRNKKIIIPNPYLSRKYDNNDFYHQLISKILKKSKNHINEWGGKLYVIYLPDFWRYEILNEERTFIRNEIYKNKKINFLNTVSDLGLKYLDFDEILKNHSNPLNFFDNQADPHYNTKGYKLLSHSIYKFLNIPKKN